MTPKEKAIDLFDKMCNSVDELLPLDVKQCALIAVDEIIYTVNMCIPYQNEETYVNYWQQVKIEIEKL
jgi:hypothetical protein